MDWSDWKFYAFPPVANISKVLSKMKQDEAEGILIVEYLSNQICYSVI